jgi:SAM-dependent methyltransferase
VSRVEISDHIAVWDADTGARLPVRRTQVVDVLEKAGDRRGARIVARMRAEDDVLDATSVDSLLLRVHRELQRLHEEMRHGERVAALLGPLLATLRASATPPPYRIVDIGCGLGYVVRFLALRAQLGDDVDLVGVDLNATLVTEARRLAEVEGARCTFVHGDAFTVEPATIYLSSGVVHHFRYHDLVAFLAAQSRDGVAAVCHFDIAPTRLAPVGTRIFHLARMRVALSRHDGVVSALRAHTDKLLVAAARRALPGFVSLVYDPVGLRPDVLTVIRPLVAVRPELLSPLRHALGARASRLVVPP